MKAHISDVEKQLDEQVRGILQKVRTSSLKEGMRAALGVILDKTKQTGKSEQEILEDIKEYCAKALQITS